MKTFKTVFVILMALVAIIVAAPSSLAKVPSAEQLEEFNKKLPMDVEEGMTCTLAAADADNAVMVLTFKINPRKMDMSLDEAKSELNSYNGSGFREFLGDDFASMLKAFDCDVQIVLEYPDGTDKKILMSS